MRLEHLLSGMRRTYFGRYKVQRIMVVSAYFSQTVMKYTRKMKPSTLVRGSQGLIISASPIAQLVRAPH